MTGEAETTEEGIRRDQEAQGVVLGPTIGGLCSEEVVVRGEIPVLARRPTEEEIVPRTSLAIETVAPEVLSESIERFARSKTNATFTKLIKRVVDRISEYI